MRVTKLGPVGGWQVKSPRTSGRGRANYRFNQQFRMKVELNFNDVASVPVMTIVAK